MQHAAVCPRASTTTAPWMKAARCVNARGKESKNTALERKLRKGKVRRLTCPLTLPHKHRHQAAMPMPQHQIPMPRNTGVDTTASDTSAAASGSDATASSVDATASGSDATAPSVDAAASGCDAAGSSVDATASGSDATTSGRHGQRTLLAAKHARPAGR